MGCSDSTQIRSYNQVQRTQFDSEIQLKNNQGNRTNTDSGQKFDNYNIGRSRQVQLLSDLLGEFLEFRNIQQKRKMNENQQKVENYKTVRSRQNQSQSYAQEQIISNAQQKNQFSSEIQIGNSQWNRTIIENEQKVQKDKTERSKQDQLYYDIQTTLQNCKGDLQKFFQYVQGFVSKFYISLSQQTLTAMSRDGISEEKSKIIIAEGILLLNLNILKIIGQNNKFNYHENTFQNLNKFQKNLAEYMQLKYPRGQKGIESDELNKIFKPFDRVNKLEYDILIRSNTYFGEPDDDKIIKNIKLLINKIIKQCEDKYPEFVKLMQNKVFISENEKKEEKNKVDNVDNVKKVKQIDITKKEQQVNKKKEGEKQGNKEKKIEEEPKQEEGKKLCKSYKIGRKIPPNSPRYTKFDTGVLEVFSPQIFRILVKWMQDLERTIYKTRARINKKSSFKCYIGQEQKLNQNNEKKLLFDEINHDECSEVLNKLTERIEGMRLKLDQYNVELFREMNEFNTSLLKILYKTKSEQKYIPIADIEIIKFSCFNAKFIEFILTEKLVLAIKQLIKVGQSFETENMMTLDLVNFKVTDLMRCMATGNKRQIIEMHENFKELEKNGQISILRIKNRLSTPLNDVMVIFVMKGSWIICEAQLILSEAGSKINKNQTNIDVIGHFFYELQRTPYGILAQTAVLLAYKDNKVSYENKITFGQSQVDIENCRKDHPQSMKVIQEQNIPFICSKCLCFYSKLQDMFQIYECYRCKISICSKCILKNNPERKITFTTQSIERSLSRKMDKLQKQINEKLSVKDNYKLNGKEKQKIITTNTLFSIFDPKILNFFQIFGGKNKLVGFKLMEYLDKEYGANRMRDDYCYFLIIDFLRGEASFKFYFYDSQKRHIENTFDSREMYDQNSSYSYSDYDMLLFLPTYKELDKSPSIKDDHFFLSVTQSQLQEQVQRLKKQGKQQHMIVSIKIYLERSYHYLVLDYRVKREKNQKMKRMFKNPYKKFAEFAQTLPAIQRKHSTIQLDDIGIETIHLEYFQKIDWKNNIKNLKIAQNKITDITVILQNCPNLQKLYFSQNYVKQLYFSKQLPNLQTLHGSMNRIQKLTGLENVPNLIKLFLNKNELEEFSQSNYLTNLKVLNLKKNYLKNISSIIQTLWLKLQQLIISDQQQESNKNQSLKDRSIPILIKSSPKLRHLECSSNFHILDNEEIVFESKCLENISLNKCKLSKLTFVNSDCIQNLKYLRLAGNNFKSFNFLKSEQNNTIQSTNSNPNSSLKVQNEIFQNNNLIQLDLSSNDFQYLPVLRCSSLKKLLLANNNLKDVESLSNSKLPSLQNLDLSKNQFKQIFPLKLNKLKELKLQQVRNLSRINSLFSYSASQLGSLQKIIITQCFIYDFIFNVKKQNNALINLKELIFKKVDFISKEKEQSSCFEIDTLETLIIDDCTLQKFPIIKLQNLKQLKIKLDVDENTFESLEKCELPSLETLTIINTSNKMMKHGMSKICAPKLKFLKTQRLEIVNLDQFLQSSLPYLQHVQILHAQAQIFSDQSIAKLKSIKYLDLSHNCLNKFLCSEPLDKLTYLNLENNKLKYYPQLKVKNLTNLMLGKQKLQDISGLEISYLPLLKIINLKDCLLENSSFPKLNLASLEKLSLSRCKLKDLSGLENSVLPLLKMISLWDCSLEISSFPKLNLASLQKLSLSGCKLKDLSGLENSVLPLLKMINLKDCSLENSSFPKLNLASLDTLCLSGCKLKDLSGLENSVLPLLKKINLWDCSLENSSFPKLNLVNLDNLYLDRCKLKDLSGLEKSYLPLLKQINLWDCSLENSSFPKLNLVNLDTLCLSGCKLKDLSGLENSDLPLLKIINLKDCSLENSSFPIINFASLEKLCLSGCKLKDLSGLEKSYLPLLKQINLWNCSLENSSFPKLNLASLDNLCLSGCKPKDLSGLEKSNLPLLKQINLWDCLLENSSFPKLSLASLDNLCLSGCKLKDLSGLENSDLPFLKQISLWNCSLENSSFPKLNMASLDNLYLRGCNIKDISNLAKSNLPQLRQIYLESNYIQVSPEIKFSKITILDQRVDVVKDLNSQSFLKLQTLSELRISQKISSSKIFSTPYSLQLKQLRTLQIINIPVKTLPQLEGSFQLVKLSIEKCQLTDISSLEGKAYFSLNHLSFSINNLTIIPKLIMGALETVNFFDNQISQIEEFFKSSLPGLKSLNFQKNKLSTLKTMPFSSIQTLNLSDNPLKNLNCFYLEKFPSLQQLYFNNTQFKDLNWLQRSVSNLPQFKTLNYKQHQTTMQQIALNSFPKLKKLHILNTPLQNINALISFKGLDQLQSLQISLDVDDQNFNELNKNIKERTNNSIKVQKFKLKQII